MNNRVLLTGEMFSFLVQIDFCFTKRDNRDEPVRGQPLLMNEHYDQRSK